MRYQRARRHACESDIPIDIDIEWSPFFALVRKPDSPAMCPDSKRKNSTLELGMLIERIGFTRAFHPPSERERAAQPPNFLRWPFVSSLSS
jgi:hypothetical protein